MSAELHARIADKDCPHAPCLGYCLPLEAAAEIERLRRALVSTQESVVAYEKLYGQGEAADEIKRLKEVITDFVEAREALNKNEWRDDSGAFRSAYQDASRALEREARHG